MTSTSKTEIDLATLRAAIVDRAGDEGFEQCGFMAPAELANLSPRFEAFVEKGWHGDLDWLANHLDRRVSPTTLWPEAGSVFVVGMNYGPPDDPLVNLAHTDQATISCYAQHRDYHDVMKKKLRRIARWIADS